MFTVSESITGFWLHKIGNFPGKITLLKFF